jgi:hypothetical protein
MARNAAGPLAVLASTPTELVLEPETPGPVLLSPTTPEKPSPVLCPITPLAGPIPSVKIPKYQYVVFDFFIFDDMW